MLFGAPTFSLSQLKNCLEDIQFEVIEALLVDFRLLARIARKHLRIVILNKSS